MAQAANEAKATSIVRSLANNDHPIPAALRKIIDELKVDRVVLKFILRANYDLSHEACNTYHDWSLGLIADEELESLLRLELTPKRLKPPREGSEGS